MKRERIVQKGVILYFFLLLSPGPAWTQGPLPPALLSVLPPGANSRGLDPEGNPAGSGTRAKLSFTMGGNNFYLLPQLNRVWVGASWNARRTALTFSAGTVGFAAFRSHTASLSAALMPARDLWMGAAVEVNSHKQAKIPFSGLSTGFRLGLQWQVRKGTLVSGLLKGRLVAAGETRAMSSEGQMSLGLARMVADRILLSAEIRKKRILPPSLVLSMSLKDKKGRCLGISFFPASLKAVTNFSFSAGLISLQISLSYHPALGLSPGAVIGGEESESGK